MRPGEAGARQHEPCEPGGDRDRQAGGDERAAPALERDVVGGVEVEPRITFVCIRRQRHERVEALHEELDHGIRTTLP